MIDKELTDKVMLYINCFKNYARFNPCMDNNEYNGLQTVKSLAYTASAEAYSFGYKRGECFACTSGKVLDEVLSEYDKVMQAKDLAEQAIKALRFKDCLAPDKEKARLSSMLETLLTLQQQRGFLVGYNSVFNITTD